MNGERALRCRVTIRGAQCHEIAAITCDSGCIHEHLEMGIGICHGHRDLLESRFQCIPCRDGADPHTCFTTLRVRAGAA